MSKKIDDLIQSIEEKHLSKGKEHGNSWIEKLKWLKIGRALAFLSGHKTAAAGIVSAGVLAFSLGFYILGKDYFTKRQAFPIRHVIYQSEETVFFSGGEKDSDSRNVDRKSETVIKEGNIETKIGELLGLFKVRLSDEAVIYEWEDANKVRIAYAHEKHEKLQAGLRFGGTIDFSEQFAKIIGKEDAFITYSFTPERGHRNSQLNVILDKDKNRTFVNELVTYRTFGIGWLWGTNFRAKTELNEFPQSQKNQAQFKKLSELITLYNNETVSLKERESIVRKMMEIEEQLDKTPIMVSYEDGIFDILPQESTTYLFSNPSVKGQPKGQKIKNTKLHKGEYPTLASISDLRLLKVHNPNGDIIRMRVENFWHLWPGNWWFLNKIKLGTPPNILKPFAHYNNGGYEITDSRGTIAKISIEDFILHFGNDVLYKYYLDKDGNGKIDEEKELIGQVLYRVSQDEGQTIEKEIGKGREKKDITKRFIYTFMAGHDFGRRFEEFYLSNTIESFIVNELNRGFGKHSDLGWINNQRSNILLINSRTVPNLGRALTPESSLVAKYDIIALLRAAGRNYIEKYVSDK